MKAAAASRTSSRHRRGRCCRATCPPRRASHADDGPSRRRRDAHCRIGWRRTKTRTISPRDVLNVTIAGLQAGVTLKSTARVLCSVRRADRGASADVSRSHSHLSPSSRRSAARRVRHAPATAADHPQAAAPPVAICGGRGRRAADRALHPRDRQPDGRGSGRASPRKRRPRRRHAGRARHDRSPKAPSSCASRSTETDAQVKEAEANAAQIEARLGLRGHDAFDVNAVPEVQNAKAAFELARQRVLADQVAARPARRVAVGIRSAEDAARSGAPAVRRREERRRAAVPVAARRARARDAREKGARRHDRARAVRRRRRRAHRVGRRLRHEGH